MKLPSLFLNEVAEVKHFKKSGLYGNVYDGSATLDQEIPLSSDMKLGSFTVRCRINRTPGFATDRGRPDPNKVAAKATGIFPLDARITVNMEIFVDGMNYKVIEVYPRTGYVEAWLS